MKTAPPPQQISSLSSKPPGSPLGTLWSIRNSPWTSPMKIALTLSGRTVVHRSFIPILTPLTFLFHLPNTKITAPILRLPNRTYLTNSFHIAFYLDSNRITSNPSLFPSNFLPSIEQFSRHAALLNAFWRKQTVARLRTDPNTVAAMFAPRWLRGRFFTPFVMRVTLWNFERKYRQESLAATKEAVYAVLEDIQRALAQHEGHSLRYLCGGRLTYADIVVVESLFFEPGRGGTKFAHMYRDDELAHHFPDLVAWGKAVRETHFNMSTAST